MKNFFSYNDSLMKGIKKEPFDKKKAYLEIEKQRTEQGFFQLPFAETSVFVKRARELQKKFDRLIVVGIGGSDLGAKVLWESLWPGKGAGMELIFLSNPDPDALASFTKKNDYWKKTALCVVSKSGRTLETWSVFLTLLDGLKKTVGEKKHKEQVFVLTEQSDDNPLEIFAARNSYEVIPHPTNVGGRFSVLSAVGLFPAACANLPVNKILAGAKWMQTQYDKQKTDHTAVKFAEWHVSAIKQGKNIHVLMPYSEHLAKVGFWFRQLWAESLGKNKNGPTPVAALGAIDQHSQIQLYNEGPKDKVVTFIRLESFLDDQRVPSPTSALPKELKFITKHSLGKILNAEQKATAKTLAESGCPNGTIILAERSPETIGALLQFFMLATVYAAEFLKVDAYNQPGVEAGKKEIKRLLT